MARGFTCELCSKGCLKGRPDLSSSAFAYDAELLTSELMTNACRYSTGLVTVLVLRNTARVVVTVTDDTGGEPLVMLEQDPERGNGRGLFLVDTIAGAWGTTTHTGGKSVWFRLP